MNTDHIVGAAVKLNCDQLTDAELAAMNICIQLGTDPRKVMGYEKAKPLFTTIPTPRQISSDCGTALRFDWGDHDQVQMVLAEAHVEFESIHSIG